MSRAPPTIAKPRPPAVPMRTSVWLAVPDPSAARVSLWRVDQQTMRVTRTVTVGKSVRYLQGMEIAAGDGSLWVTNFELGTVVRIDPASGTVKATIKLGRHPFGIAFGADRVWVTVS